MDHKTSPTGKSEEGVHWCGGGHVQFGEAKGNIADPAEFARFKREVASRIEGWDVVFGEEAGSFTLLPQRNLVVNVGVARSLDNLFGINGTSPAPSPALGTVLRIGVDNGTTNPVAASISSDAGGGADTGSSSQTLRTFNSAATRTALVTSAAGTFNDPTTGGIGAVGFIMKRLFLSAHTANITNTTSADAANTLYSMTAVFTIDFTGISTWSLVFTATVTGAGT